MLPFLLGCGYYARVLPTQFPRDVVAKYAGAGNIASWIAQFMGHGFAEGRAPALLDNLFQVLCPFTVTRVNGQSLYLAPLFVWLEVLFAFGYRPSLKKCIDDDVKADKLARAKTTEPAEPQENSALLSDTAK